MFVILTFRPGVAGLDMKGPSWDACRALEHTGMEQGTAVQSRVGEGGTGVSSPARFPVAPPRPRPHWHISTLTF